MLGVYGLRGGWDDGIDVGVGTVAGVGGECAEV